MERHKDFRVIPNACTRGKYSKGRIMGVFGSGYPPGCSGTPFDEEIDWIDSGIKWARAFKGEPRCTADPDYGPIDEAFYIITGLLDDMGYDQWDKSVDK